MKSLIKKLCAAAAFFFVAKAASAADISVSINNTLGSTIGIQVTPTCNGATCTWPSTIANGATGSFNATFNSGITSAQLIFEYGKSDVRCRGNIRVDVDASGNVTNVANTSWLRSWGTPTCSQLSGPTISGGDVVWSLRMGP